MSKDNQNIEKKYNEVYDAFIDSTDDSLFTKNDVKKIVEAHKYKDFMENYKKMRTQKRRRNIVVSAKSFGKEIVSLEFMVNLFLTYLFYVGSLVLITSFIYPNILEKTAVFIVALVFTLVDKLIKPFIFFFDLVTFTFHKIGLVTLALFSVLFYIVGNTIKSGQGSTISIEKSIIVAIIVLFITFVVDYINKQSLFKTKLINEEFGSEDDE